jgi:hypothetical protein
MLHVQPILSFLFNNPLLFGESCNYYLRRLYYFHHYVYAEALKCKDIFFAISLSITPKRRHGGTLWRIWLRHCATSRKVAGHRFFHWLNPCGHTLYPGVDLASPEGDKGDHCVRLTTLPPSCTDCLEIPGSWTPWNPKGLYRNSFTFLINLNQQAKLFCLFHTYLHNLPDTIRCKVQIDSCFLYLRGTSIRPMFLSEFVQNLNSFKRRRNCLKHKFNPNNT